MEYKSLDSKKEQIRSYIKQNPNATHRSIKKDLKIKLERVYPQGITSAFKDAGVRLKRTITDLTSDEKKEVIISYVKNNSKATLNGMRESLKINPSHHFKSIKNIYKKAGISYPRDIKKLRKKKINLMINLVKKNPYITCEEIIKELRINPYKIYNSIKQIYQLAEIEYISPGKRLALRKKEKIIDTIKKNPTITQWEINKLCKTHIQEIFQGGIKEAYKLAGIEYPKNRLVIYGAADKKIKNRAKEFENNIYSILSRLGDVDKQIISKSGVADFILKRNKNKIVVEVKDYRSKPISNSDIKQIYNYMNDHKIKEGWIICHTKPRKEVL